MTDGQFAALRVSHHGIGTESQAMEDCGRDVFGANQSVFGLSAQSVRRSVDHAALNAAASHGDREDRPPMIATRPAIEARSAAELAHANDQRFVQQSAALQIRQQTGREPTTEELAKEVGLSVEETERIMKTWKHPISLDTPVGESEDSSYGDFLQDSSESTPADSAMHQMLRDKINHVLKSLTYREREIIKLRYGLGDGYSYTLEETGRIFKVTRERIRQIEAKAVRKLQQPSRSQELVGFLD